ncbi:MAG: hypothetical protein NTW10_14825 [Bacteroidetes bacterium]|nr:hypothetical protein [Bacteroidota bacterium]
MKTKLILLLTFFLPVAGFLCGQGFSPGKERWPVKTSVTHFLPVKEVSLAELMGLRSPILSYTKEEQEEYQDQRFSEVIGTHHLKEGDIVITSGYILLAALEKDSKGADADYHIQIRTTSEWADSCLVVEAAYPPFIKGNVTLQDSCRKVRDFFDHFILKGRKKVCFGNKNHTSPYVKITGQLFFDAFHVNTPPRGKQNSVNEKMKSYTCWEIHPITSISFVGTK